MCRYDDDWMGQDIGKLWLSQIYQVISRWRFQISEWLFLQTPSLRWIRLLLASGTRRWFHLSDRLWCVQVYEESRKEIW
jgi:hypothetical protein